MNSLELALSAIAAVAGGSALLTAIKTLIDTRNKSIDEFLKERQLRNKKKAH